MQRRAPGTIPRHDVDVNEVEFEVEVKELGEKREGKEKEVTRS